MQPRFYRPQLDVVRFCAFFAVFNHHVLPRTGNSPVWNCVANACGFGLSLFFVLSAYLISLVLLQEREQTGRVRLRDFYVRRALRIWPLYLVGLAIGVLRALSHGVLDDQKMWFLAALFLAGNLLPANGILMSHLWSISVEEQFYLLFPSPGSFGRKGMLTCALLLLVAANVSLWHFARLHAALDTTVWFSSFVQFQMFASGILLALLDEKIPRRRPYLAGLCLLVSGLMAFAAQWSFHLKSQGEFATSASALCAGYGLVALACCLFLVGVQQLPTWSPFVYLGKISFGLYVFHIPVMALLGERLHTVSLNIVSVFAGTVLLASASYHFLEKPFLQLKRRFEIVATRPA